MKESMKRTTISLTAKMHQELKIKSIEESKTMNKIIVEAITKSDDRNLYFEIVRYGDFGPKDPKFVCIVKPDETEWKYDVRGFVSTNDIDDIKGYSDRTSGDDIEGIPISTYKEEKQYHVLIDEFDTVEMNYIIDKYLDENGLFEMEEEYDEKYKDAETAEKILFQNIKAKMLEFNEEPPRYRSLEVLDNNSWKELLIEHENSNCEPDLVDCTEELQGSEELDYRKFDSGHMTLNRLRNGSKVVFTTSYYAGPNTEVEYVDENILTLDDYLSQEVK